MDVPMILSGFLDVYIEETYHTVNKCRLLYVKDPSIKLFEKEEKEGISCKHIPALSRYVAT